MQVNTNSRDGFLAAKTVKGFEYIPFREIVYIKADLKYAQVYLKDQLLPVKVFASITLLDKTLPSDIFYRCHRSYILNLQYRRVLGKDRTVSLIGNHNLPISDDRFSEFIKRTTI